MTRVLQWRDAGKAGVDRDGREVKLFIKELYEWNFALEQVMNHY